MVRIVLLIELDAQRDVATRVAAFCSPSLGLR